MTIKVHEKRAYDAVQWHSLVGQATFPGLRRTTRACRIDYKLRNKPISIEVDEKHHFPSLCNDQVDRDAEVCRYFIAKKMVLIRIHYTNSKRFHQYLDPLLVLISSNIEKFRGKVIIDHNEYIEMIPLWKISSNDVVHVNDVFRMRPILEAIDPRCHIGGDENDVLMTDIVQV